MEIIIIIMMMIIIKIITTENINNNNNNNNSLPSFTITIATLRYHTRSSATNHQKPQGAFSACILIIITNLINIQTSRPQTSRQYKEHGR